MAHTIPLEDPGHLLEAELRYRADRLVKATGIVERELEKRVRALRAQAIRALLGPGDDSRDSDEPSALRRLRDEVADTGLPEDGASEDLRAAVCFAVWADEVGGYKTTLPESG